MYAVLDATALQLSRTDATNPLSRYDELCSAKYNFDSQCYPFRLSLRETAKLLLGKGLGLVAYYNMIEKYPANSDFDTVQKHVTAAAERIDALSNYLGASPEGVRNNKEYPYSYVLGKRLNFSDTSGFKGYYRVKNSDAIDGAIFDHSASAYKNWTTVDMNSFVSRIQYNTLAEELKAAGIDTKYDMLFQMNTPTVKTSGFQAIATVSGKTIKLNDNKVSENELGKMSYPGYGSPQYTKTRDTVFVYVLSN